MKLSQMIDGLKVVDSNANLDMDVSSITKDSREVRNSCIFFAIKGSKNDGLNYAEDAVKKGAVVLIDREPPRVLKKGGYIRVEDITEAMNLIAVRFYGYPFRDMKMVGVTGTNGKSSITYLVESIARRMNLSSGVIGTINYRYNNRIMQAPNTTPDPLLLMKILAEMRDNGVDMVVMEVSSHGLALRRTAALKFDVVIFTNLSRDHLDFHRDMEEYFEAKRLLFSKGYSRDDNSAALINADDEYGERLLSMNFPRMLTYSLKRDDAFVHCKNYEVGEDSIKADIVIDDKVLSIDSHLIGLHNLYNIMAASGAMYVSGAKFDDIYNGIYDLRYVPGRLQKVENDFGVRCLVDYAHSDDSLRNVLKALSSLNHRHIITVFGAGGDRDRGKRPLMAGAVCEYSDIIIITSDNPRTEDPLQIIADIERGIDARFRKTEAGRLNSEEKGVYTIIPDRSEAIEKAVMISKDKDILLIAGKGHEDYIIEGTQKRYFSDIEEAERAFGKRSKYGAN